MATVVINAQKRMMPIVSILVRPWQNGKLDDQKKKKKRQGEKREAYHRVLVHTGTSRQSRGGKHDKRRDEIHESVGSGRKQRQRSRGDGRVHLDDEETKVDTKRSVDGKTNLGPHFDGFSDGKTLLVTGTEELVDELVLTGVVLLELPLVALRVFLLHLGSGNIFLAMPPKVQGVLWVDSGGIARRRGDIFADEVGVFGGLV